MPDRRTRAYRLAEAMKSCGVGRTKGIAQSRPCVLGTAVPVQSIVDRFAGGDAINVISNEIDMHPALIEDAIRFYVLFPKCDLPSFWKDEKTKGYEEFL